MKEKILSKPYLTREYPISELMTASDETTAFEMLRNIFTKNRAIRNEFVEKMLKKHSEGKVKPMDSFDKETLYDLHHVFNVPYEILGIIFDIPKKRVSHIFCTHQISSKDARWGLFLKYGAREIDVDKFVAYLSYE